MPNNAPPLIDDLRLSRRALEEIPELQLLEDFRWYDAVERWGLKCRLTVQVSPEGLVPEVTDWFLLLHPDYPAGTIDLFPAKAEGLTVTFPHQAFNGEGRADLPWRSGKLCLETDLAVLRRQGLDQEPRTAKARLTFYVAPVCQEHFFVAPLLLPRPEAGVKGGVAGEADP